MPNVNIKVDGEPTTNVTLYEAGNSYREIPGSKDNNGEDFDLDPGDYDVVCITRFGGSSRNVTCTVTGANGTVRTKTKTTTSKGKMTLIVEFRLTAFGEVK